LDSAGLHRRKERGFVVRPARGLLELKELNRLQELNELRRELRWKNSLGAPVRERKGLTIP
jgi:hypothetical protein